jgi:hypothetical protein
MLENEQNADTFWAVGWGRFLEITHTHFKYNLSRREGRGRGSSYHCTIYSLSNTPFSFLDQVVYRAAGLKVAAARREWTLASLVHLTAK